MTIDATEGGASANSYVTAVVALEYFLGRHSSEGYRNSNATVQERLLRTATLFLDSRINWVGHTKDRVTPQALEWPRVDSLDVDSALDISVNGQVIPQDLKNAQCELALYLVNNGEPSESSDLDSVKVGSLVIDFNEFKQSHLIPSEVWAMVSYLGTRVTTKDMIRPVALCR